MIRLEKADTWQGDVLIIGVQEGAPETERTPDVFQGKQDQVYLLQEPDYTLILVGLGDKPTTNGLRRAMGQGVKCARSRGARQVGTTLPQIQVATLAERVQACTEGALLALYTFDRCKTDVERSSIKCISLCLDTVSQEAKRARDRGQILAHHTNGVRDMANAPSNLMTPLDMERTAKRLAKESGLACRVYNKKQIQRLGLRALLAVNSGSQIEPRFIILEHKPRRPKKRVLLVGKGITFDSGGVQIKPPRGMAGMKYDMTGGAIMMHTVAAVAKCGSAHHVIACIPTTENMPGGEAYKPGDVIKMYNGKTVEVNHTDAEGRLVLADGLAYGCKTFKPDVVFDAATLTGAATVALGEAASVMVSTDDKLVDIMERSACATDERVWRLPLWQYHKDLLKSKVADLSNIGMGSKGYEAGSIVAAAFLSNFLDCPWVHLDVAGTSWAYKEDAYQPEGATGWGVRLLTRALEQL